MQSTSNNSKQGRFAANMALAFGDFAAAAFEVNESRQKAHDFRVNAALQFYEESGRSAAAKPPSNVSREFAEVETEIN